ncbi:hypothetical protein CBF23_009335 [Marinomonas agarivorans]|nr:hypothetical protein CBF23_009335 [Marinomonas agarivorans]
MSSQVSLTNQRLDAARRFLNMEVEETWMEMAYENAALFHLQSALVGLLQEIKQLYSLNCFAELDALLVAAKKQSLSSPVLTELAELTDESTSWLNSMNSAYSVNLSCQTSTLTHRSSNLISISNSNKEINLSYLRALSDIIVRFREESVEY